MQRIAGTVKINGVSYRILREKEKLTYERKSVPKTNLSAQTRRAISGVSNLIEYSYGVEGGYGDAVIEDRDDHYHFAANMFMEHNGESVLLPGHQYVKADPGGAQEISLPPAGIFELYTSPGNITTFVVQDCKAMYIENATGAAVQMLISKTFEQFEMPSDALAFNNIGYVAMGSKFTVLDILSVATSGGFVNATTATVHRLAVNDYVRLKGMSVTAYNGIWKVTAVGSTTTFTLGSLAFTATATGKANKVSGTGYLRRLTASGGTWSKDDNAYKTITAVADSGVPNTTTTGNRPRFASVAHGYVAGDIVQLVNFTVAVYNSMSTASVSTLYTVTNASDADHFDVEGIVVGATATGNSRRTDSDVVADQLVVVGDLLVRGYLDPTEGWVTSRVDAVASNPLLDANWTAGIGTVGVGDVASPINEMVAVGTGEVVLKPEGAFTYQRDKGAYLNAIPELEEHRHPENGIGSTEHKGWVYIPTIIGVLRYKNGQVQNVTPGRGGQQSFESPVGPIGHLFGDAERLYGVTRPFRVNQPKQVSGVQTAIYADLNNAGTAPGTPDFNLDPTIDLTGMTAAGYVYLGSTRPWHRMNVEMDSVLNTLFYSAHSGFQIDASEYWNGSAWTTRAGLIDYTRVRNTSSLFPSSFGQSGDLVFTSEMPTDWVIHGTTPSAGALSATTGAVDMYWCRFSLSGAIGANSVQIKRVTAGIHVAAVTMTPAFSSKELTVDHGGMQFVVSMTENPQKGVVWRTMWGWKQPDTTMLNDSTSLTYTSGGASPTGACAVIQPNNLRSANGSRFLYVGLHHNSMILPLGHVPDPTEDGPFQQQFGGTGREAWLVFPDSDAGLPYITKTLQEINFDLDGFTGSNVEVFYRGDGGAWTSAGTAASLPIHLTAGSEPTGLMFGLALSLGITADAKAVNLPRLITMPTLRFQPHPEMAEVITMTVELEPEELLPGQVDRRSAKTAYAALRTLQTNNTSVAYVDVDESTDNVHVMQIAKHVLHNAENAPRVTADLILAVVTTT